MKRRKFIASASCFVAIGSGCLGVDEPGGTNITISNEMDALQKITIQVRKQSDNSLVLDDSFEIESGSEKEYDGIVSDSRVIVDVRVENGPENKQEWYGGQESSTLLVYVRSNGIEFEGGVA